MSESRLAHVIWQAAKFLVSQLEKEFGLGKKPEKEIHQGAGTARG